MEINSFWDGELSTLEILCISSFLQNGATYNLYVYDPPRSLPAGVVLKDASLILPRERIFRYSAGEFNVGSIAGFTNLFRYTAVHQMGGWWIDTDVCCLRPFDVEEDEFYLRETSQTEPFYVSTAMFKAMPGSAVLREARERFEQKDIARVVHGETGPKLLTDVIVALGKEDLVRPNDLYIPVPWWEYRRLFFDEKLSLDHCCGVHFWNAMIGAEQLDKNASFGAATVYEKLKRKYLTPGGTSR